jgi:glycosyltransferase involved in cell wall biosynthesis
MANPLSGIPAHALPLDRRWLEVMWERLNAPKVDRWCSDADWVYTPAEAYISVRHPRLAVTVHDLHAFEPGLPWSNSRKHQAFHRRWSRMFAPIIKHADCILAVSEFTRQRLIELLGVDADRIAVVGNGVEAAYFDLHGDVSEACIGPYIMVIGGLTWQKGGDLVLRVAELLSHEMSEVRILVAGSGQQELNERSMLLRNVVRLGYVETARLVHLLRGAMAMLCLSRYEGFGIPVIEAMATGTPVIASRWGALPEVVADAGLLVDAENVQEVVSAIRTLSADTAMRMEMVARGRKRAEEYRWEACVERLVLALRRR